MRNSEDIGVRCFFPAAVELHGADRGCLQQRSLAPESARFTSPPRDFDGGFAACRYNSAKRHGGNAHAVAGAIHEKGFPENVHAIAGIGVIQFFVQRAYEHDAPESFYGAGSLIPAIAAIPAWRCRRLQRGRRVCPLAATISSMARAMDNLSRMVSGAKVRNEPVM